jgi:hypothetical protein
MTLTKDGLIHIIGGLTATVESTLDAQGRLQWLLTASSMSDVPVYNTVTGQWDLRTASGQIPPSRNIHSASLGMSIPVLLSGILRCITYNFTPPHSQTYSR